MKMGRRLEKEGRGEKREEEEKKDVYIYFSHNDCMHMCHKQVQVLVKNDNCENSVILGLGI